VPDFIYVLRDPRTSDVKYVGKTKNPYSRKKAHSSPSQIRGQGIRKIEWTLELISLGLRPQFEIIEECEDGKWKEREEFWIAHYGLANLVNVRPDATPGNLNACSENTKEKLRRSVIRQFSDVIRRQKHKEAMQRWSKNLTDEDRKILARNARLANKRALPRPEQWVMMTEEEKQKRINQADTKWMKYLTPEQKSEAYALRAVKWHQGQADALKRVWEERRSGKRKMFISRGKEVAAKA